MLEEKFQRRRVECLGLLDIAEVPGAGTTVRRAPAIIAAIARDSNGGVSASSSPTMI